MANLSNINNKFLVTTGGNVLIGQTGAIGSSLLQVNGIIGVGSSNQTTLNQTSTHFFMDMTSSTSYFRNTSTAGGGFIFRNSNIGDFEFDNEFAGNIKFNTSNVERMRIDSSGNLLLNQATSRIKGGGSTTGRLELSNSDSKSYIMVTGSANAAPNLIYFVNDAAVTLTLNQDNSATFAGNVGIGAAASDGNLHVRKTGVNTGITNVLMNANFADGSNGTGLSIGYRTDETTAVIAARTATGNIAFYSYDGGWSESMRIKNNGNVGIGTITPDATLELYNISETSDGDGSSTETLSGQDSLLLHAAGGGVDKTTGSITWRAGSRRRAMITSVQENADGDYQGISFYTQGTDGSGDMFESMRIAHSGELKVTGNGVIKNEHSSANYSYWQQTASDARLFTQYAQPLYFGTNASTKMTILSGGNVGIGTLSPSKNLEVAGSYKLGTNAYIQYDAGYPYTINMLNTAAVGNLILNAGAGSSGYESKIELQGSNTAGAAGITLSTGSTTRMRITSDGSTFLYPSTGTYGLSMNDTNQVMNSGYVNGNQTVSLTYTCTTMSSMSIECVFNHYGYVASYGCARVATFAVGPVITIQNILEVTSANGGSWTFNRVSNTEFTVAKTAGTYQGGGRWFVKINGARVFAA